MLSIFYGRRVFSFFPPTLFQKVETRHLFFFGLRQKCENLYACEEARQNNYFERPNAWPQIINGMSPKI